MTITSTRELVVLTVLRDHPCHGYALHEVLSGTLGPSLGLTRANIYAILSRFERRGWIATQSGASSGAPDRSVHTVTVEGRDALNQLLPETGRIGEPVDALVGVIALLDELDPPLRERRIRELLTEREEMYESLGSLDHPGSFGAAMTLRKQLLAAELAALQALLT